jgi:hypothetical protein
MLPRGAGVGGTSPKGGRRITITALVMKGRRWAITEVRSQCAENVDHVVKVMYWASGNGQKKDLPGIPKKDSKAATPVIASPMVEKRR